MPSSVLSTTQETHETGAALDAKRVALAWLLGGFVLPRLVPYVHFLAKPFNEPYTVVELAPFETAFGLVCAVLLFLWMWPGVFQLSRLRPRVSDLAIGVVVGYVYWNVDLSLPSIPIQWPWNPPYDGVCPYQKLLFACHILVVPVAEELVFRGVILSSLSKWMSVLWAVLITAAAAAAIHTGPDAFLAQLVFCGTYLARHRSLPASIACHAVTNALLWFPSLLVLPHLLK